MLGRWYGNNMRFLVDESAGKKLANLLSQQHEVVFVGDVSPSITDEAILAIANKQKRILITNDKDFGELVFRFKKPNAGIILLRTLRSDSSLRYGLLLRLFKTANVHHKFIVLTEIHVRIRKLR